MESLKKVCNNNDNILISRISFSLSFTDFLVIPDNGILSLQWDQIHQDSEDSIQVRGAKMTLKSIVQHFKSDVTSKPPKFFERVVLPFQQDHLWRGWNFFLLFHLKL